MTPTGIASIRVHCIHKGFSYSLQKRVFLFLFSFCLLFLLNRFLSFSNALFVCLLWAELSPLQNLLKSSPPVPQNVTAFGNKIFKKGNEVKMRSSGWALIQHDWCPDKKRWGWDTEEGSGDRDEDGTQRKAVETKGKGSHLQVKERGFRRNQICQTPRSWISSPMNREEINLMCKLPARGTSQWQP